MSPHLLQLIRATAIAVLINLLSPSLLEAFGSQNTDSDFRLAGVVRWEDGALVANFRVEILDDDGRVIQQADHTGGRFSISPRERAAKLRAFCTTLLGNKNEALLATKTVALGELRPRSRVNITLAREPVASISAKFTADASPVAKLDTITIARKWTDYEPAEVMLGPVQLSKDGKMDLPFVALGRYELTVSSERSWPRSLTIDLDSPNSVDLGAIRLAPLPSAEGQVVDVEGNPLAGVAICSEEPERWWHQGVVVSSAETLLCLTGPSGEFRCTDTTTGLWVVSPGLAPVNISPFVGKRNLKIVMRPLVPVPLEGVTPELDTWSLRIVEIGAGAADPLTRIDINSGFPENNPPILFLPVGEWQLVAWDSAPEPEQVDEHAYFCIRTVSIPSAATRPIVEFSERDERSVQTQEDGSDALSGSAEASEGLLVGNIEFVRFEPGDFRMGSPASEVGHWPDERTKDVSIEDVFFVARTEITQAQFFAILGEKPWQRYPRVRQGDAFAACYVDWYTALRFCEKLQEVAGESVPKGLVVRLPTEAEWEYACRAGSSGAFSFGDESPRMREFGWFTGNTWSVDEEFPHEVASKLPGPAPWRLFDMHGNVLEWCLDGLVFVDGLVGEPVQDEPYRAVRGGSWRSTVDGCRCANRDAVPADYSDSEVGFRPVLGVPVEFQ